MHSCQRRGTRTRAHSVDLSPGTSSTKRYIDIIHAHNTKLSQQLDATASAERTLPTEAYWAKYAVAGAFP